MKFGICPHDTSRNMTLWLSLNAYLRKRVAGLETTLTDCLDFSCFYAYEFQYLDMAYVNPMDAYRLQTERGFIPVCGTELYDEVVYVASLEAETNSLTAVAQQPLACVDRQFATYLGTYLLRQKGIAPGPLQSYPSWLKVIATLMKHELQYGLLYKDFYDQLSDLAKRQIQVIEASTAQIASHILMISPEFRSLIPSLQDVLLGMDADPDGRAFLAEARLGRWHKMQDLADIRAVVENAPVPM